MSFDLDFVRKAVNAALQDKAEWLDLYDLDVFISRAVRHYSDSKSRYVVYDITGDTTSNYALPESAGFYKGFSIVTKVEYPAGETPPTYRTKDDFFVYEDPSEDDEVRLRFCTLTPSADETIRVTFTGYHTLTEDTTTLKPKDADCVILKTLALAFEALAALVLQGLDKAITADSVQMEMKAAEYRRLAKSADNDYRALSGIKRDYRKASLALTDGDLGYKEGASYLWHPPRSR